MDKTLKIKASDQIAFFRNNGKYIPDLFIELNENKEILRYFIWSKKWKKRIIQQYNDLFENYHGDLLKKGIKDNKILFSFKPNYTLQKIHSMIKTQYDLFRNFHKEDSNPIFNEKFSKFEDLIYCSSYIYTKALKFLDNACSFSSKRLIILRGSAGNGKTNLMCSVVDLLLKSKIGCIFINARDVEIKTSDFFMQYLNAPSFFYKEKWDKILLFLINAYSKVSRRRIFVLIDAINENDSDLFCKSLGDFLSLLLRYGCFKVMLSCRSEYFEERYSKYFKKQKQLDPFIFNIDNEYTDRAKEKIHQVYVEYFNFTGKLAPNVKHKLRSSLLLTRIFYEVYRGSSINIISLNRCNLFKDYIENISSGLDTSILNIILNKIANNMLKHQEFDYIPISNLGFSEEELNIFKRIADNNLLINKTLTKNPKLITQRTEEVVYFVFDELRDYCIARFLLTKCEDSGSEFHEYYEFIDSLVCDKISPYEGVLRYGYTYFKQTDNDIECQKIIARYFNIKNRPLLNEKDELFNDFWLSLLFETGKKLKDFEIQYIGESLKTNKFHNDVFSLFDYLWKNGLHEAENTVQLLNDVLLEIEDYSEIKAILSEINRHDLHNLMHYLESTQKRLEKFKKDLECNLFLTILSLVFEEIHYLNELAKKNSNYISNLEQISMLSKCEKIQKKAKVVVQYICKEEAIRAHFSMKISSEADCFQNSFIFNNTSTNQSNCLIFDGKIYFNKTNIKSQRTFMKYMGVDPQKYAGRILQRLYDYNFTKAANLTNEYMLYYKKEFSSFGHYLESKHNMFDFEYEQYKSKSSYYKNIKHCPDNNFEWAFYKQNEKSFITLFWDFFGGVDKRDED